MQGSANVKGTLDATFINVASDVRVGSKLETAEFDAGEGALTVDIESSTVTMGDVFAADTYARTVKVYDEWQVPSEDGSSMVASSGLANVATEHDIAGAVADANEYTDAASSSIMNTINALPGVGEGAILYDIIEDE